MNNLLRFSCLGAGILEQTISVTIFPEAVSVRLGLTSISFIVLQRNEMVETRETNETVSFRPSSLVRAIYGGPRTTDGLPQALI